MNKKTEKKLEKELGKHHVEFPSIMVGAPPKSNAIQFVEKAYAYKAFKTNYKNELRQLRHDASKEFRVENKGWFLTLDIIGLILILFNLGALFMTGALVIKADPTHSFVEANPAQCQWNGFACHDNAKDIILPFFKQAIIWAILIGAYIFTRNNTYNITGLWLMTAMMILYISLLTLDFNNDLGLYVGKIIWGR